ncbi:MAG TPA: histidine phosphatase family protein [Novosphingobium sp.]
MTYRRTSLSQALILLCAGATASSRAGGFAAPGEPLDAGGRRAAEARRVADRFHGRTLTGPAVSARETAAAMGLSASVEPALAEIDHGAWTGRSFAEIHAEAPEALATWIADPTAGAPGGERMADVAVRAGAWLAALPAEPLCAITHPMTIRCLLADALGLPLPATLGIDLAPLAQVRLSFHGRWRLQAIEPA